jgi:hypothetical protein
MYPMDCFIDIARSSERISRRNGARPPRLLLGNNYFKFGKVNLSAPSANTADYRRAINSAAISCFQQGDCMSSVLKRDRTNHAESISALHSSRPTDTQSTLDNTISALKKDTSFSRNRARLESIASPPDPSLSGSKRSGERARRHSLSTERPLQPPIPIKTQLGAGCRTVRFQGADFDFLLTQLLVFDPSPTSLALPHPTSYNRLFACAVRKQPLRT